MFISSFDRNVILFQKLGMLHNKFSVKVVYFIDFRNAYLTLLLNKYSHYRYLSILRSGLILFNESFLNKTTTNNRAIIFWVCVLFTKVENQ